MKILCEFESDKRTFVGEDLYIHPLFTYRQIDNFPLGLTVHTLEIKGKVSAVLIKNWLSLIFPSVNLTYICLYFLCKFYPYFSHNCYRSSDEKDLAQLSASLKCQRTDCIIRILFKYCSLLQSICLFVKTHLG